MKRLLLAWMSAVICAGPVYARNLTLWYDKPANKGMNEALPIGNGKFGGLIYAGPKQERVVLNEISLWTGSEISTDDYAKMGSYQMLGELLVDARSRMPPPPPVQNYRRSLDLATAIHTVSYQSGGVTYRREAFASHADQVMVLRFSADRPGACGGAVRLQGAHKETTAAAGNSLKFSGALDNGLKYEAKLVALHDGGTVQAGDGKLEFKNCNSLTLLVAAGTDYVAGLRPQVPRRRSARRHREAAGRRAAKKYDELKAAHIADFQSLFNRVALDVGATPADRLALPTDQRKVLHAEKGGDPDLEELLFQYGRYLLISCSRPGGLPANLQGLWNDSNNPPWHSDYHANINIQMNYWLAEPANLAECHTAALRPDHQPARAVAQGDGRGEAVPDRLRQVARLGRPHLARHQRRHGLAVGHAGQRLVLPAFLDALRLRRRQGPGSRTSPTRS